MAIMIAPTNIKNPTVPFNIPPIRGKYPSILVIGEKNNTIPNTIIIKATILIIIVKILDFLIEFSIICSLVANYSSTKLIYSIGLRSYAIQLDKQQQAGS